MGSLRTDLFSNFSHWDLLCVVISYNKVSQFVISLTLMLKKVDWDRGGRVEIF